jgi:RHS repeat-associated protein
VPVTVGTQDVVAAVGDEAGNVGYATNTVIVVLATNASYGYSAAGCVTSMTHTWTDGTITTNQLSWNSNYQLTSVTTNDTTAETYEYGPLGRRTKIVSGDETRHLIHDGIHVIAETDSDGGMQKSYTWGPGVDNLLAFTDYTGGQTNTYYALTDHLGSVHALVNSSGTVVESYRYDAWGKVLGVYDADGKPLSESAVGNNYLWQGRWYSWETGLYYFRARWYDPVTGRWLSKDPIGISGGLNQYVFCRNNPVNRRDPLGMCDDSLDNYPWGYEFPEPEILDGWEDFLGELGSYLWDRYLQDPVTDWAQDNPLISIPAGTALAAGVGDYMLQSGQDISIGGDVPIWHPTRNSEVTIGGDVTITGDSLFGGNVNATVDEIRIGVEIEF